jgi:hypothetical protein
MPADNGFRFDDDQGVAPRGPKPAEQNPEYPILGSEPGVGTFSLEYAQLPTEGQTSPGQAATGTEENIEKCREPD